jgi:hypothetical protein
MKKAILIAGTALLMTSCSYSTIGDLNMVSNRNVSLSENYIMLGKQVQGKGKEDNHNALENALHDAVSKYPSGEFMMNVKIMVRKDGQKVKVIGDVMGTDTVPNGSR